MVRQTLFADFELQIHRKVEERTLTAEFLDNLYLELTALLRSGSGRWRWATSSVTSGLESHFYYRFYVYQYSTVTSPPRPLRGRSSRAERRRGAYLGLLKSGGRTTLRP